MELLTLFFASLFVVQTVIFVILYRRAVTRHNITHITNVKPNEITESRQELEQISEKKSLGELHKSAISALKLIQERGSVISSDVSRSLNLSREHTARLMKTLYEKGLVKREGKPFRYSLTEKGLNILASAVKTEQPKLVNKSSD